MKFFRKIKYRLRRFIISLISVLFLCSVFIVSASADVLPLSDTPLQTDVQPYYWDGSQWVYSDTFTFVPGKTVSTGLPVTSGNAFGMTFTTFDSNSGANSLNVSRGTLHFKISFITNIYFTSPRVPYVSFGHWVQDSDGQVSVESASVESNNLTYNSTTSNYSGSGSDRLFLVTTEIFIDSSYIPYSDFFNFYFYIQRDSSPSTRSWVITCDQFICEVLTGSDVPSYSAPDTSAKNELDSTEETLNHTFESYNVRLDGIFDLTGTTGLLTAVGWWSQNIFGLFINNPFLSSILTLSLAVGIFSLLFGLFGSIVSASNYRDRRARASAAEKAREKRLLNAINRNKKGG